MWDFSLKGEFKVIEMTDSYDRNSLQQIFDRPCQKLSISGQ